jgi:hypothetical protein
VVSRLKCRKEGCHIAGKKRRTHLTASRRLTAEEVQAQRPRCLLPEWLQRKRQAARRDPVELVSDDEPAPEGEPLQVGEQCNPEHQVHAEHAQPQDVQLGQQLSVQSLQIERQHGLNEPERDQHAERQVYQGSVCEQQPVIRSENEPIEQSGVVNSSGAGLLGSGLVAQPMNSANAMPSLLQHASLPPQRRPLSEVEPQISTASGLCAVEEEGGNQRSQRKVQMTARMREACEHHIQKT